MLADINRMIRIVKGGRPAGTQSQQEQEEEQWN